MRANRLALLVAALVLIAATCSVAGAAYYNPAKTVVVFIGGFDPNGHHYTGVYGDDFYDPLMETMGQLLGAPSWQTDPTAPNQIAATTYYGMTPPAWYTAQDIADVNAQENGIPRYAMRVAKYIKHVLERAPRAQAVNLISGSMGCEVARYMIEHDFCQLASNQKIVRWAPVVGVICGAWPATNIAEWFANLLGLDTSAPEVQHMKYPWVDSHISARTTMNTSLYGPMLIQQFISTRDSDGYFTTIANIPNDCTLACQDEYFWGYSTTNALHTATDGTKQMPGRSYSRTNHTGIASNPAMWVNYVAFSKGTTRVTITLTRVKAKTSGDSWLYGDGDWVFESRVTSPLAASQFGCTTPISEINKDDGVAPCYRFASNQTKYPNAVLFDQVVLPGETQLSVRFWAEELDWFTAYYSMWEPGSNITMGDWTFTVPTTSDSTRTFSNGNMEAELQIKVRQTAAVAPNVAPTARFAFTPTTPTTQDTIQFDDNSTDTDGVVVAWSWDFGDGTGIPAPGMPLAAAPRFAAEMMAEDEATGGDTSTPPADDTGIPVGGGPVTDGTSQPVNADGVAAWGVSEVTYVEPGLDTYAGPDPNNPNSADPNGGAVPVTETTYVESEPVVSSPALAAPAAVKAAPPVGGTPNPTHRFADDGTYTVTLTVWDDEGASSQKVKTVTVLNVAPTARFTFSPATPTDLDTVTFTNNSTDLDGTIASAAWDFGDGTTSTEMSPTHQFADDGTYSVSLIVTDDDGAVSVAKVKEVVVTNVPPTAGFSFSPAEPTDLDTVTFTDSSTDGDGTIASWSWEFGDGATATEQNPTHKYADDGTYTVTLKVTDDDGDQSTALTKQVVVKNVPPTAAFNFSPAAPTDLESVSFTDASTDGDGTVTGWAWDFGDGATASTQNPTHRYADDGTYVVTLKVTDDDGDQSVAVTQQVVVKNVPPEAGLSFSPTAPTDLQTVTFTDTSTDADGSIAGWAWSFGDGETATTQNPTHRYADDGTYTVTLTVTDDDGDTDVATTTITVLNVAPTANLSFSPAPPTTEESVTFTDASSDPDGSIVAWSWDLGDGTTSTQAAPTHQYGAVGSYQVKLTVTDDDGATATVTKTVSVVYTWLGFLPPLDENRQPFKGGSTIPVKFRIQTAAGPVTDAVATLSVVKVADGAPSGDPLVISMANGDVGNTFRYSPDDDLYIFNLSTKGWASPATYRATVTLNDGSTHSIDFGTK